MVGLVGRVVGGWGLAWWLGGWVAGWVVAELDHLSPGWVWMPMQCMEHVESMETIGYRYRNLGYGNGFLRRMS